MTATTTDQLVPPVIASELADWVKASYDDPTLNVCIITATSWAINFLKQDLITRSWTLTDSTRYHDNDGIQVRRLNIPYQEVLLPYTNLIQVDRVVVAGEETTNYQTLKGQPYKLILNAVPVNNTNNEDIIVEYKAGFGPNPSDVPETIRTAIILMAGYIYAHQGCDSQDVLHKSGAHPLLVPYAVNGGIAL